MPLVEIVSAPDMRSAEEAREYVEELRAMLVATGASDGKMEEGSLRVDCNVSVRPEGSTELGDTLRDKKHELVAQPRPGRRIRGGPPGGADRRRRKVAQETRHWDEADGRTHSMRSKEEAFDYRYFPEPDLVALDPGPEWVDAVKAHCPNYRRRDGGGWRRPPASRPSSEAVATVVRLGLDDIISAAVAAKVDPAWPCAGWPTRSPASWPSDGR